MRNFYVFGLCFIVLLLLLSACTEQDKKVKQEHNSETKQQKETGKSSNNEKDGVFNTGSFKTLKGKNDIGTYHIGPVSFTIKSVAVKRGEEDTPFVEGLPEGEIDVVKVLMILKSEQKDIQFTENNFKLRTDSGETFDHPEKLMSTAVNIELAYTGSDVGPGVYHTTVTYVLKETKAEEINEVTLLVKAPSDKNGETLGENLTIDIPVSKPK